MDNEITNLIKDLTEKMGINRDMIRHVYLSNGIEFIGEMIDISVEDMEDTEKELAERIMIENEKTFFQPLKISEDGFISSDGTFQSHKYFEKYNPYSEEPFTLINKNAIISMSHLHNKMLFEYLKNVDKQYYGFTEDEIFIKSKGNVISFQEYKSKKS